MNIKGSKAHLPKKPDIFDIGYGGYGGYGGLVAKEGLAEDLSTKSKADLVSISIVAIRNKESYETKLSSI